MQSTGGVIAAAGADNSPNYAGYLCGFAPAASQSWHSLLSISHGFFSITLAQYLFDFFHAERRQCKSSVPLVATRDMPVIMTRYREYVGWGAIVLAALAFLPIPLPQLPPMLTSGSLMLVPGLGGVLMMLYPMLLFAAGIGLVKGWHGGRQLFAIWSAIAIPAALAAFQYNYVFAVVDLTIIVACILILFWGDWRLR